MIAWPTVAETLHRSTVVLSDVAGDDARLETEVLLAHALGIDRAHLLASLGKRLPPSYAQRFDAMLVRRMAHEPLAYIIGSREFYGIDVRCSPAALIPRPESELLVDFALDEARRRPLRIADIGTGTGAIAIAIAVNAPDSIVVATDVSSAALTLARHNIESHRIGARVRPVQADLLHGLGCFDLIIANLPYVAAPDWERLPPEIRDHEPRTALVAGETGTEAVACLLDEAPPHLAAGGALAAEIGDTQGDAIRALAEKSFSGARIDIRKDLASLDRMLVVRT